MHDSERMMWEEAYRAALNETDPEKLAQRVLDAEGAMFRRGLQLNGSANDCEEQRAMNDAAADLLALKTHKLGWPFPTARDLKARQIRSEPSQ